jgi:glycosyltransferase involved in cell wall biosynthesis
VIHFFPLFSRDAADTLFGEALRATGVEHRIFATAISRAHPLCLRAVRHECRRAGRDHGRRGGARRPGGSWWSPPGARVTLLDHCHGAAYLAELAAADIVVVPLAVATISAGQIVIIQAKVLGRPVITTDTVTTRDSAVDGEDALLVPLGDAALCQRLGANATASYLRNHGTYGYMASLVEAIGSV